MPVPTAVMLDGQLKWSRTDDEMGHREYKLTVRVETSDSSAGPAIVMTAPGLPQPGAQWRVDNDFDEWAFCLPNAEIKPDVDDAPNVCWKVTYTFTTKGMPRQQYDDLGDPYPVGNPLLEPAKISVEFSKYTEEATYDRFGVATVNSAFESLRGPQNEWDRNRAVVKIKINLATDPLADDASSLINLLDKVNDAEMWNQAARCIKLSNATAEKKFYGFQGVYWETDFTFDVRKPQAINPNSGGFDRDVLDEATKVLSGTWATLPGQGALFNITAAGGIVSAVAVADGGNDYPPLCTFDVFIIQVGAGQNCVARVTTDAEGIIVSVIATPIVAGTGYVTAGGLSSTVRDTGWVLIPIGGQAPDPNNPTHFIRFLDREGKNITGVLNGAGIPSGVLTSAGGSPGTGGTINILAVNGTGGITIAEIDNPGSDYLSASFVLLTITTGSGTAEIGFYTDGAGQLDEIAVIVNAGTGYAPLGNVATAQVTQPGRIHLEKYDQANLLFLGIPPVLSQLDF